MFRPRRRRVPLLLDGRRIGSASWTKAGAMRLHLKGLTVPADRWKDMAPQTQLCVHGRVRQTNDAVTVERIQPDPQPIPVDVRAAAREGQPFPLA